MSPRSVSRIPLLAITTLITYLVAAGAELTLVLVAEWVSPRWSRVAILLQGGALLLAGIRYRWRPSWRLLLYPLVLASVLYLWDSTLPPPTLPDGPIRVALPLTMLIGIVVDVGLLLWQTARPHQRFVHAYAGRVALVDAARIAGISPEAFRMYCRRTGRPIIIDATGMEELWLADVLTSLAPTRMRASVFVRAHPQLRPRDAPTRLEVLRWPIGIIWWLAVGVTTIVQMALNTALPQFRASFTNVTVLLLIVALMALLWPLGVLLVSVDSAALRIRLGLVREQIALGRIVACQVTKYRWQAWGGFGRHRRGRERLYNVPGDAGVAVELVLDDGQRVLFSARDPQAICQVVRAAAARARQHPRTMG
jgi:hypothetical protein